MGYREESDKRRAEATARAREVAAAVLARVGEAHPKEIDAVLSEIWDRAGLKFQDAHAASNAGRRAEKDHAEAVRRYGPDYLKTPTFGCFRESYAESAARHHAEATALNAEGRAILAEGDPFEAEFRRRPWRRYFLVTSSAHGHVHRERTCSTCNPRTTYAWIVNLAGCDEAAMVREYGVAACTTCFPDAPTLPGFLAKPEDPSKCNGQPDEAAYATGRLYGRCAVCGYSGSIRNRRGDRTALRKHKRADA